MKYTVQSGKYIAKNFIYLFPFAILPAILLSFSTDEKAIILILDSIFEGNISQWTFFMLFRAISILNFGSWKSAVAGVLGVVFIVPCVAMMMALIEKHLRIGKRTFNGLWAKLNDNLIPACGYAFLLLLIYEVWALLAAAILFFVSRVQIAIFAYVTSASLFLLLHVVLLYCIGLFYLWLPCMQITGFRAFEALHYSQQLVTTGEKWRILSAQMIFMLLAEVLICLCAVFIRNFIVFTIVTTLLYAILLLAFCVRMQLAYFDLDHIERADLTRYYQKR